MMAEAIQYLRIPDCPDRKQRFDDIIYVTQVHINCVQEKCSHDNLFISYVICYCLNWCFFAK